MAPALDGLEFSREKALEMRAKLWEMAEECTKQAVAMEEARMGVDTAAHEAQTPPSNLSL